MGEDYQIMKPRNFFSRHFSDLVVYALVPVVSVLIPASFSRRLIVGIASWQWLLNEEATECYSRAAEYTTISDPQKWKRRWRLVTILEVRDLSLLSVGRRSAVFNEISCADDIGQSRDRVLIGMHWGPSIALLGLLQSKGQNPLFVYRPVEPTIFKSRPWYYLFLKRSVRYINKTCGDRAIRIKGAGAALARELPRPGTSVGLLDAPPAPGRSTIDGNVIGRPVKFNAGFPEILDESGREYHFYAMSLDDSGEALKVLELAQARRPESQQQLIRDYCEFLGEHINKDSAQWRIWQAADQFFQPAEIKNEDVAVQG